MAEYIQQSLKKQETKKHILYSHEKWNVILSKDLIHQVKTQKIYRRFSMPNRVSASCGSSADSSVMITSHNQTISKGARELLSIIPPKVFILVMFAILTLSCTIQAGDFESIFGAKGTQWISNKFAQPRFVDNENGKGYEFLCDFSLGDPKYPRCYWDTKFTPIDFSQTKTIVMKISIANIESVNSIALFLESEGIWHLSKRYDKIGEGVNLVFLNLEDFHLDGTRIASAPEQLKKVTAIRFNVFNSSKKSSVIKVSDAHLSPTKLDNTKGLPLFQTPADDMNLKRANNRDRDGHLLESRLIFDESSNFLKEGTDIVLSKIKKAGFNVYAPSLWHGRGAVYRSKSTVIEPQFAKYFSGADDPTADMIKKAHSAGIEVHASFCISYRGKPDPHPEFPANDSPDKAYDLQDPAYRDFIVGEIINFTRDYNNIDGINLDFIRTRGISFSKIARELYQKKYGANID